MITADNFFFMFIVLLDAEQQQQQYGSNKRPNIHACLAAPATAAIKSELYHHMDYRRVDL
jgi:hypothetical protein